MISTGCTCKLNVGLSSAWANASINYFENEKMKIAQAESSFAQKARNELIEIETKLDRLLDLQLDGSLSQAEYTAKKHKLILAKKDLEEKISAFGRKSNNRFELAITFLKEANKPKNTLNKKIPKGFGIFSKRLVRTSALPTALCFWISFRPSKLRKNTMPRRFAPRQFLTISQKVKIGGVF